MPSPPITLRCVPDIYLTEERLLMLFSDFNASVLTPSSSDVVLADVVNRVRQPYVSQILLLQQQLLSTHPVPTITTPHEDLRAQHAQEMKELQDHHNRQLRDIREQERLVLEERTPREWLIAIDVVYGDQESQKPASRIKELTGRGDSINYGHGGKYVWLVPKMSTIPEGALTRLDIVLQDDSDPTKRALEKGTGGKYRYLRTEAVGGADAIYCVNLIRLSHAMCGAPDGYQGSTSDINQGRAGGYLYLVWKSWSVK